MTFVLPFFDTHIHEVTDILEGQQALLYIHAVFMLIYSECYGGDKQVLENNGNQVDNACTFLSSTF